MKNNLTIQAKKFVQEVCIDTWQMSEEEIKSYCLMIVKQNTTMAKLNKDYLETAKAYAPLAGLSKEEIKIMTMSF